MGGGWGGCLAATAGQAGQLRDSLKGPWRASGIRLEDIGRKLLQLTGNDRCGLASYTHTYVWQIVYGVNGLIRQADRCVYGEAG